MASFYFGGMFLTDADLVDARRFYSSRHVVKWSNYFVVNVCPSVYIKILPLIKGKEVKIEGVVLYSR